MAVIRVDGGIPGLVDEFEGFDLILFANLLDEAVTTPKLGMGQLGFQEELKAAGFLHDPRFGAFDAADADLAQLDGYQIYATLVPETQAFFTASASVDGVNYIGKALNLADGEIMFIRPPGLVAQVDQRLVPETDFGLGGRPFQSLGIVEVSADPTALPPDGLKLEVLLNQSFEGLVSADGVLLRRVDTVLPSLRVLNLEGNPLDNRAHEYFIPQLEARASTNLIQSQFAIPETGRLNVDLTMTLDVVRADSTRVTCPSAPRRQRRPTSTAPANSLRCSTARSTRRSAPHGFTAGDLHFQLDADRTSIWRSTAPASARSSCTTARRSASVMRAWPPISTRSCRSYARRASASSCRSSFLRCRPARSTASASWLRH